MQIDEKISEPAPELRRPNVFSFTNYREYLRASFNYIKSLNHQYSETAFIRQAGFSNNSRGYFSLIINCKRNLTPKSISGFAQALKLSERETQYFENLVYFNQADNERDETYFLNRLSKFIKGRETPAYELLISQYNYFSKWQLPAIKELMGLKDFIEDADWISKQLRRKVTAKQVEEAILDLQKLNLIRRGDDGKLQPLHDIVLFDSNKANFHAAKTFISEMMVLAKESFDNDPYPDRAMSSIVVSMDSKRTSEMNEEIKIFREHLITKYGVNSRDYDTVMGVNFQLFYLSNPPAAQGEKI